MSPAENDTPAASGVGWRPERIETVPMTPQEHDDAVRALAALIAVWLGKTTRKTPPETRGKAA